jgi:hypothetical protein
MLTLTLRDRLWAAYVAMVEHCEDMAEAIEAELREMAEATGGVDAGRLCFLADRVLVLDGEAERCRGIATALEAMAA